MGFNAKVTSKGQITIPAALRDRMGIEPGDRLEFKEGPNGQIMVEKMTNSFNDLRGIIKLDKPVTSEQIDAWIAEARSAIGTRK